MPTTTCRYDSGAMDDCRPLCNQPAKWEVVYRNGTSPTMYAPMCDRHVKPMQNRAYPGEIETRRL